MVEYLVDAAWEASNSFDRLVRSYVCDGIDTDDDEATAYEVKLCGVFLATALLLIIAVAVVWRVHRDVLAEIYFSPQQFEIKADKVAPSLVSANAASHAFLSNDGSSTRAKDATGTPQRGPRRSAQNLPDSSDSRIAAVTTSALDHSHLTSSSAASSLAISSAEESHRPAAGTIVTSANHVRNTDASETDAHASTPAEADEEPGDLRSRSRSRSASAAAAGARRLASRGHAPSASNIMANLETPTWQQLLVLQAATAAAVPDLLQGSRQRGQAMARSGAAGRLGGVASGPARDNAHAPRDDTGGAPIATGAPGSFVHGSWSQAGGRVSDADIGAVAVDADENDDADADAAVGDGDVSAHHTASSAWSSSADGKPRVFSFADTGLATTMGTAPETRRFASGMGADLRNSQHAALASADGSAAATEYSVAASQLRAAAQRDEWGHRIRPQHQLGADGGLHEGINHGKAAAQPRSGAESRAHTGAGGADGERDDHGYEPRKDAGNMGVGSSATSAADRGPQANAGSEAVESRHPQRQQQRGRRLDSATSSRSEVSASSESASSLAAPELPALAHGAAAEPAQGASRVQSLGSSAPVSPAGEFPAGFTAPSGFVVRGLERSQVSGEADSRGSDDASSVSEHAPAAAEAGLSGSGGYSSSAGSAVLSALLPPLQRDTARVLPRGHSHRSSSFVPGGMGALSQRSPSLDEEQLQALQARMVLEPQEKPDERREFSQSAVSPQAPLSPSHERFKRPPIPAALLAGSSPSRVESYGSADSSASPTLRAPPAESMRRADSAGEIASPP